MKKNDINELSTVLNMRNPHRLIRLANPIASYDGKHFAVEIETENAEPLDVEIPLTEVGTIVEFLVNVANHIDPSGKPDKIDLSPIQIRALNFADGRTSDETLLIVRLGGFDLAFALDNNQIAAFGLDFAHIAQALSARNINPH